MALGVLVGLAIPRFHAYKRKAHIASMIGDLRKLAGAEESFWSAVKRYTTDTTALELTISPGVTLTLVSADSTGWSARATHRGDLAVCSIFYGTAPSLPPATKGNVIGCGGREGGEEAESRKQEAGSARVQEAGFRVQ